MALKLTDAMRQHARKNLGVAEAADDGAITQALGLALAEDRIPQDVWKSLQDNKTPSGRELIVTVVSEQLQPLQETLKGLSDGLAALVAKVGTTPAPQGGDGGVAPPPADDPEAEFVKRLKKAMPQVTKGLVLGDDGVLTPSGVLADAHNRGYLSDPSALRQKSPLERYSAVKSEARWPGNHKHPDLRNKRVTAPGAEGWGTGRPLDTPSQQDKAVVGAYMKWVKASLLGRDAPASCRMTDHDWELVHYMVHQLPWTGYVGADAEGGGAPVHEEKLADVFYRGLPGTKAILDDSTSGGIQAAPIVVDDALIIQPLLFGELFPLITVVNLARGRRIHQATLGRPTLTSGTPEGTPISLFDTTNFLGTLDASIFTAVGAMEIGLDFEEDSPAPIGDTVIALYSEAAMAWLDRVIAIGDGTTEPLGIFNASGIVTVASVNGAAGPLTVSDAESLMFGVNKAYRTSRGGRNVFVGNETAYRRFRAIPSGTAMNNVRAFGNDYGAYMVLNFPMKIVTGVPNNWVAFSNLGYYRMWRRLGITFKVETAGKTLSLANTKLIVARMRFGGLPEQGGAFAVSTDGPA
jgi:HK97 family phage major capsid protein